MARDPSGIYTYPDGTPGVPYTPIRSARYNTFLDDLALTLNTALPINMGGTGASTPDTAITALGGVKKSGDTMTGALSLKYAGTRISLNSDTVLGANVLSGDINDKSRWGIYLGNGEAETGSNAGSNFVIARYNDAGVVIDAALTINRQLALVKLTGDLDVAKVDPRLGMTFTSGAAAVTSSKSGSGLRWSLALGDGTAETGGNAGTNFVVNRYSDAAAFLSTAFSINRATGLATFNSGLTENGTLTVNGSSVFSNGAYTFNSVNGQYNLFVALPVAQGAVMFQVGGASVGSISCTASSTAYNTSSDARLKEDLKSFDAGNIIDNTMVYDFAWKATGERSYGVIAQQAVEVYDTPIFHDEKEDHWFVDYSKYVPVILQELKALRTRVAELEGKLLSGIQPA